MSTDESGFTPARVLGLRDALDAVIALYRSEGQPEKLAAYTAKLTDPAISAR